MDWMAIIFPVATLAWFGYEFVLFVRDLDARDARSRERQPSDDRVGPT